MTMDIKENKKETEDPKCFVRSKRLILYSFGIGAVGVEGILFFLEYYAIAVFHEFRHYPYLYPYAKGCVLLSFLVICMLVVIWLLKVIERKNITRDLISSLGYVFIGCLLGPVLYKMIYWMGLLIKGVLKL